MSIILDGTTGITTPTTNGTAEHVTSVTGFKNRIINGGMVIDQRNAGASVTPVNAQYLVDRFVAYLTQVSKFTAQQNAGAITPPAGYINYLGITSSSAYSVIGADEFQIGQSIEGLNVADLAWGTANAQSVTLSFWVRSSLTGTFGGSIRNSVPNRSYCFSYTVSSANTWTQISVTIAGDTLGTWLTTNGSGLLVVWGLGSGSTRTTTANVWTAGNYVQPTGSVSVVGTSGATFYITGVQLEKGSVATSFDYRPYGTELSLCCRYWQKLGGTAQYDILLQGITASSGNAGMTLSFPVSMRAAPTATKIGTWTVGSSAQPAPAATSLTTVSINSSITGPSSYLFGTTDATTYISLSAEL